MGRTFIQIFASVFLSAGLVFGGLTFTLMRLHTYGAAGLAVAAGLGVLCGTLFGVLVGYYARTLRYEFECDASVDIPLRLELLLKRMGYQLETRFQKVITFRPTLRAGLLSDRVRVELLSGRIVLEGPQGHIEKIRATLGV